VDVVTDPGERLSRVRKSAGFWWLEMSGGGGVGQVHLLGPVPGDGLVRPDLAVLDAELLRVLGEHLRVVDLVENSRSYLRGAEAAFA
jgi:hypothetical protein